MDEMKKKREEYEANAPKRKAAFDKLVQSCNDRSTILNRKDKAEKGYANYLENRLTAQKNILDKDREEYDTEKDKQDEIRNNAIALAAKLSNNVNQMCDMALEKGIPPIDNVYTKGYEMEDKHGNKKTRYYRLNYTQHKLFKFGKQGRDVIFKTFFDETKVNANSCMDDDCLHPCYNTEYTMHCPMCWLEFEKALVDKKMSPEEKAKLVEKCGKCEVPPADDLDLPAPFKEYVPRQFSPAKTFDEWVADKTKK